MSRRGAVDVVGGMLVRLWRGMRLTCRLGSGIGLRCLESGTVLFEAKDGKWEPLGEREVMEG